MARQAQFLALLQFCYQKLLNVITNIGINEYSSGEIKIDIDLNLTPCTGEFELDCRPKFQHQSIKFLEENTFISIAHI